MRSAPGAGWSCPAISSVGIARFSHGKIPRFAGYYGAIDSTVDRRPGAPERNAISEWIEAETTRREGEGGCSAHNHEWTECTRRIGGPRAKFPAIRPGFLRSNARAERESRDARSLARARPRTVGQSV